MEKIVTITRVNFVGKWVELWFLEGGVLEGLSYDMSSKAYKLWKAVEDAGLNDMVVNNGFGGVRLKIKHDSFNWEIESALMGEERKFNWESYAVHDAQNIKGFFGSYRYLSNFHVAPVYFDGVLYPSSENAYQAAKTLDLQMRKPFETCTPAQSKKMGRGLTDIRHDWTNVKVEVMSTIVFDKFYRNTDIRVLLLSTGDRYIEETNHWKDQFWGVCEGKGMNMLGKIITGIRSYWRSVGIDAQNGNPTQLF